MKLSTEAYLEDARRRVDETLETILPPAEAHPETIHAALRYAVLSGGKRVRAALVLLCCEAVGGRKTSALHAAAGFELIHASSLVLDDLPSQDDSSLRRGRPATHVAFGESTAMLASTALLTLGIQAISENARREGLAADEAARIVARVTDAVGTEGMIGGQIVDLALTPETSAMETLEYVHSHKTGALFIACAQTGAMLGGGGEREIAALASYAKNLGLAYQIADDILDHEGSAERLGKPVGQDKSKPTFVNVFGIEVARTLSRELYESAESSLGILAARAKPLVAFTRWLEGRTS